MTTLAATLGAFAAETPARELPPLAIERAKMSLASTLASASVGHGIESARIVRSVEKASGGTAESSVWFCSRKLPAERAARVNAVASDAAASDDSDMRSIAHIGTVAGAVGLAMGERQLSSGLDILAAMVLGYEVAGRIDEALTPGRMQRGFHGSVSTIFAGAVTAGRLLHLDAPRMTQAIALAASSACGMAIAADTSCAREYHAGLAAQLGTQAALAAHAGFQGETAVLESRRGFFEAFNGQAVSDVSLGLGEDWDIVTDMAIKLMPGAHPFHAIAEAAVQAAIDGDVPPEQVQRIVITAPQLDTWRHQAEQPNDLIGAAHSVPYFVAAAVADRRFGWDHFEPEKMRDPGIKALLPRVSFDEDPPPLPDRFPHRHGGTVTIELTDGRRISRTCRAPRGSGPRGIDWADVDAKYERLAPSAGLYMTSVRASLSLLHAFDTLPSPEPLLALLRGVGPEHR